MLKIKKELNYKIIITFLFIVMIFFVNNLAYTIELSEKNHLRVPLLTQEKGSRFASAEQESFWDEAMQAFIGEEPPPYNYEEMMLQSNFKRVRRIMTGENVLPPMIEIHPSSECNRKCKICIGIPRPQSVKGLLLDRDAYLKIIEDVNEYNKEQEDPELRVSSILISGEIGEPLMNKTTTEAMRKIIEYGLELGLITNGTFLTDEVRKVIVRGKYIQISVHAVTYETFQRQMERPISRAVFEKTINNIRELVKLKRELIESVPGLKNKLADINMIFVINQDNYREILQFAKMAKDIGVDRVRYRAPEGHVANSILENQWEEIYEDLAEAKKLQDGAFRVMFTGATKDGSSVKDFHACPAHLMTTVVDSQGNFLPCAEVTGIESLIFGNIALASFKQIWEGPQRKHVTAGGLAPELCPTCLARKARMNRFLSFLQVEYAKNPFFLDWLEKWVNDRKQSKIITESISLNSSRHIGLDSSL